jgi:hypothetical protein
MLIGNLLLTFKSPLPKKMEAESFSETTVSNRQSTLPLESLEDTGIDYSFWGQILETVKWSHMLSVRLQVQSIQSASVDVCRVVLLRNLLLVHDVTSMDNLFLKFRKNTEILSAFETSVTDCPLGDIMQRKKSFLYSATVA